MDVDAFRDGVLSRVGVMVALSCTFRDAALWHAVLWLAAVSRPYQVFPGAYYHMSGTMAVVAVSQDGGHMGNSTLVDGGPLRSDSQSSYTWAVARCPAWKWQPRFLSG
ncbi:Hypothetical predicted protein, partial [Marmota monax]